MVWNRERKWLPNAGLSIIKEIIYYLGYYYPGLLQIALLTADKITSESACTGT